MSHNQIKIGSSTPNTSGVITPNLIDFNVASVNDSEALGYTTAEGWGGVSVPSLAKVVFLGWQSRGGFSTSNESYDVNDNLMWRNDQQIIYDTSYVTRVLASGSYVPKTNSNWSMSWRLNATNLAGKKIVCEAVHKAKNLTGSESITCQWGIGSASDLATYTPIGNKAQQNQYYCQTAYGHYEMGSTDVYIGMKVDAVNGTVGFFDGPTSVYSYLTISIQE